MKISREKLREAVRKISGVSISYEEKVLRYLGFDLEGPEQPFKVPLSVGTTVIEGAVYGRVLDGDSKTLMIWLIGEPENRLTSASLMQGLVEAYNTLYYHEPPK